MQKQKIRVLQVMHSRLKGGAERLVLDICNEFNAREDVEYLLLTMIPDNEYPTLSANVKHRTCTSSVKLSITEKNKIDLTDLTNIIETFKPDVIHSHLYRPELLTREQIFPQIAYISHFHSNVKQFRNLQFPFNKETITNFYEKQRLIRKYRACKNSFIVISRYTEAYYKKTLPKDLHNITFLHNAINFSEFTYPPRQAINSTIRLVNVGHFSDYKNQILALRVVKSLKDKNVPVHLTLIGDGTERGNLERYVSENKLSDYITLAGKVENVSDYLKNADIYIHCAIDEPFGLVIVEAMAAGLPAVILNGGGDADLVNENNGFLIETQDVEEFCSRIISLKNNVELYARLSKGAHEFAQGYDIKPYVDKLLELYRKRIEEIN